MGYTRIHAIYLTEEEDGACFSLRRARGLQVRLAVDATDATSMSCKTDSQAGDMLGKPRDFGVRASGERERGGFAGLRRCCSSACSHWPDEAAAAA